MSVRAAFAAVHVVVALAGGCGDAVRAPITIVVDTDRARAREEQGRLQELRAGVQSDRAELEVARVELQRARQRLEATARGPQRDAVQAEVQALEARLGERAPAGLTRAELEAALQASEQRILAGLTAGGVGQAPAPSVAATAPPAATDDATARQRLAQARSALSSKGLAIADLTTGTADVERVLGLLDQGNATAAAALAEQVRAAAVAVVVDKPVLLGRYTRLNERAKQLPADDARQPRAKALLSAANKALSAGDLAAATTALEDLARDLGN